MTECPPAYGKNDALTLLQQWNDDGFICHPSPTFAQSLIRADSNDAVHRGPTMAIGAEYAVKPHRSGRGQAVFPAVVICRVSAPR